ncbi:MAG: hypothetical protein Hyperionvirus36_3 [Hyperionvirus sp.]|uniref:Uncharacterized protein n=1 Tax=Hyperionvirus sp. TaxID=2487770 RepID=A0A3G5ABX9_9VIRU|nr:MAG: hypothetical protein Hyperionvirus36_3 [Hyperionvirus sp.]
MVVVEFAEIKLALKAFTLAGGEIYATGNTAEVWGEEVFLNEIVFYVVVVKIWEPL